MAAACSRSNLQRVFVTKKEVSRLAEVEQALLGELAPNWAAGAGSEIGIVARLRLMVAAPHRSHPLAYRPDSAAAPLAAAAPGGAGEQQTAPSVLRGCRWRA